MNTSIKKGAAAAPKLSLLALALMAWVQPSWAGSLQLDDDTSLDYIATVSYGAAMRTKSPSNALVNGPINPKTGLPTTINSDDGDRNFKKDSLINNRLGLLLEGNLKHDNIGFFARGSAFYDDAYMHGNDNDSPGTINKSGAFNEFSGEARHVSGERARFLDYYAYGAFEPAGTKLDLRVGNQVVTWGESLFFPNIAGAQGPVDASKANVPGAEVKDILLPVGQVSAQWGLNKDLSLLGYYHYRWAPTELSPVGGYFSTTDVVGPGAEFLHLFANPLAEVFPGVDPTVKVTRGPDIQPRNSGQWGLGMHYNVTDATTVGLYYLRYHDTNPNVVLNLGYATLAPGITTAPTVVPVTYNIKYFDDIKLSGASFSTKLGDVSLAGEISLRDGVPVLVNTPLGPTATRAKAWQGQVSWLYSLGPSGLADSQVFVGEIGHNQVASVESFGLGGANYRQLTNSKSSSAYQLSWTPTYNNVFNGWDLSVPVVFAHQFRGKPAVAGAFGSLVGQGDKRLSVGTTFKYLSNLEVGLTYSAYLGGADLTNRPLADRDYVALNLKYSF